MRRVRSAASASCFRECSIRATAENRTSPLRRAYGALCGRAVGGRARPLEPCQAAAHLPTLRPCLSRRSIHVDFTRAHAEGFTPPSAPPRPPLAEPPVAIPSRLSQESGDGRLDHPVEPGADRQDARPGRLGEHQTVRRIWPGRRHLHAPDPREARARRDAADDRHQPRLHALSQGTRSTTRAWSRSRIGR